MFVNNATLLRIPRNLPERTPTQQFKTNVSQDGSSTKLEIHKEFLKHHSSLVKSEFIFGTEVFVEFASGESIRDLLSKCEFTSKLEVIHR